MIEGRPRIILVDTGSSLSLIQPGVCTSVVDSATVTPYAVTGDELPLKGMQRVTFTIEGETYTHDFCVCTVAAQADVILGIDFLSKMDARIDFENGKFCLNRAEKVGHDHLKGKHGEPQGTAARAVLPVFAHKDGRRKQQSCWIGHKKRQRQFKQRGRTESEMEHRPGTRIRHAGALSRAVQTVSRDMEIPRDVVKEAQGRDKFCQSLKPGTASSRSEYFTEGGLIFRRRKNGEHQLVVPLSLTHKVIQMNHDPVTVANPGRSRTLDILCLRFYWPGMRQHVEEYVRNCHKCQRVKPRHEIKAPSGDVMEPTRPWEVVTMNVCGPFSLTANKNRYVITFLDHLTKDVEVVPIKSTKAAECAWVYTTHVIARHGASSKLLTDKGRDFTSAFLKETGKILGVQQLVTTACHTVGNAKLERSQKSLCEGLSHYVNSRGDNWDTLVPFYLMAYRNTPHGTTKQSPYYMLHGREMDLPSMQSLRVKRSPDIRNTDHAPRLENLKSRSRIAYKLERDNGRKSHAANKRYYDRDVKDGEFAVGDSGYLYNPTRKAGVSAKFRRLSVDPGQVIERKSRLNDVIVDKAGKQLVVPTSRLQRARDPVEWQVAAKPSRSGKGVRPKRRLQQAEEPQVSSTGPIVSHGPQVENSPPGRRSPIRDRQVVETPKLGPSIPEALSNHKVNPTLEPSDTPLSRRELGVTRESPPLTKPEARTQILQEVPEEERDE